MYIWKDQPDWESFLKEFSQEIGPKRAVAEFQPIDGHRLKAAVLNLSGTFGLDGWRKEELAMLPVQWWDEMARLFRAIEDGAPWPEGIAQVVVALIPKEGGGNSPLDQRPIAIFPCAYRAYSCM